MKLLNLHTAKGVIIFLTLIFIFTGITSNFFSIYGNEVDDDNLINMDKLDIKSDSAVLIDLDRGQILYDKNPDKQIYDPMLPKLMTSLLAIEKVDLNSKVTVSINAAEAMNDSVEIEAGQQYDISDLIAASILTSSQGTTIAIAEFVNSDSEAFVEMMNLKASELKMTNTKFANSYGKYDDNQYTTSRDIAIFIKYALSNASFKSYFNNNVFITRSIKDGFIKNNNQMFWSYDEYTTGGKIAVLSNNLVNAITTVKNGDRNLAAVVLNTPEEDRTYVTDSIALFEFSFDKYRKGMLVSKGQVLHTIEVNNQNLNLVSSSDIYYTFPLGDDYIKDITNNIKTDISTPIEKGDFLGTITYTLKDGTVIDIPLQSESSLYTNPNIITKALNELEKNQELYNIVKVLVVIEIILIAIFILRLIRFLINLVIKKAQAKQ